MITNPVMCVVIFAMFWCSEDIGKKQLTKKKNIMCPIMKYSNFWCKRSFKKDDA
jgi:hypothetical protein